MFTETPTNSKSDKQRNALTNFAALRSEAETKLKNLNDRIAKANQCAGNAERKKADLEKQIEDKKAEAKDIVNRANDEANKIKSDAKKANIELENKNKEIGKNYIVMKKNFDGLTLAFDEKNKKLDKAHESVIKSNEEETKVEEDKKNAAIEERNQTLVEIKILKGKIPDLILAKSIPELEEEKNRLDSEIVNNNKIIVGQKVESAAEIKIKADNIFAAEKARDEEVEILQRTEQHKQYEVAAKEATDLAIKEKEKEEKLWNEVKSRRIGLLNREQNINYREKYIRKKYEDIGEPWGSI